MLPRRDAGLFSGVSAIDKLPLPLFKPRVHLLDDASIPIVRLSNVQASLAGPIDWRPTEHDQGTRLWLLNLHYMEFLEGLDDERFLAVIEDWIDNNPPNTPRYWLHRWNAYALSIRVVVWLQQVARRGMDLNSMELGQIRCSILQQMRFLERNLELDIGGNHLIKNIKALLWAGACFEGRLASGWEKLGQRLLASESVEQVLRDGMHFELSPSYHAQVFGDLLECYSIIGESNLRLHLEETLHRMAQCLVDFAHPDTMISLFGDGGMHMTYRPGELLDVFGRLTGRSVIACEFIDYPDAGYFGLRNGESLLLIDAGSLAPDHLPAHGHGDALSFELTIDGKRIFIDPGVFEYNEGEARAYSRSTTAHNTVTLDSQDQSEFWRSFRVGRRAKISGRKVSFEHGIIRFEAAHDGFERLPGSPKHVRRIEGRCGRFELRDEIHGGSGQRAVARFMLHPDCSLGFISTSHVRCSNGDVTIDVVASVPIKIESARCFLDFGHEFETSQLILDYGMVPTEGRCTIKKTSTP